jgi:hypothetical protein
VVTICLFVATRQLQFCILSKGISIFEHSSTIYLTHLIAIWTPDKDTLRRRHHANRPEPAPISHPSQDRSHSPQLPPYTDEPSPHTQDITLTQSVIK